MAIASTCTDSAVVTEYLETKTQKKSVRKRLGAHFSSKGGRWTRCRQVFAVGSSTNLSSDQFIPEERARALELLPGQATKSPPLFPLMVRIGRFLIPPAKRKSKSEADGLRRDLSSNKFLGSAETNSYIVSTVVIWLADLGSRNQSWPLGPLTGHVR
jgi:hypothetical protein